MRLPGNLQQWRGPLADLPGLSHSPCRRGTMVPYRSAAEGTAWVCLRNPPTVVGLFQKNPRSSSANPVGGTAACQGGHFTMASNPSAGHPHFPWKLCGKISFTSHLSGASQFPETKTTMMDHYGSTPKIKHSPSGVQRVSQREIETSQVDLHP